MIGRKRRNVEVEVFVDGKWQSSTTVTLKAMAGERKSIA